MTGLESKPTAWVCANCGWHGSVSTFEGVVRGAVKECLACRGVLTAGDPPPRKFLAEGCGYCAANPGIPCHSHCAALPKKGATENVNPINPPSLDGIGGAMHRAKIASDALIEKAEAVNHPPHYGGGDNPYEAIRVMENWADEWSRAGVPASVIINLVQVLKYVRRHPEKGKALEDLKKSQWYLNRALDRVAKEEA